MNEIFELLEQETPETPKAPETLEKELGDLMGKLHNGYELAPEQREHAQILELIQMKQAVLERSFVLLKQAVDTLLEDRRKDAEREANRTNKHGDVVGNSFALRCVEKEIEGWNNTVETLDTLIYNSLVILYNEHNVSGNYNSPGASNPKDRMKERNNTLVNLLNEDWLTWLIQYQRRINGDNSQIGGLLLYANRNDDNKSIFSILEEFTKLGSYSFGLGNENNIELSKNGLFKLEGKLYSKLGPILGSEFSGDIGIYETFCKNIVDTVFEDKKLLKEYHGDARVYDTTKLYNSSEIPGTTANLVYNDKGTPKSFQVDYMELQTLQKGIDVGQRKMYITGYTSEGDAFNHKVGIKYEVTVEGEPGQKTFRFVPVVPKGNGFFVQSEQVNVHTGVACECPLVLTENEFHLIEGNDSLNTEIKKKILAGAESQMTEVQDISYGILTRAFYKHLNSGLGEDSSGIMSMVMQDFVEEFGNGTVLSQSDIVKKLGNFLMDAIRNDPAAKLEIKKISGGNNASLELPFMDEILRYFSDSLLDNQQEFVSFYKSYESIKNQNTPETIKDGIGMAKRGFRAHHLGGWIEANTISDGVYTSVVEKMITYGSLVDINNVDLSALGISKEAQTSFNQLIMSLQQDSKIGEEYDLLNNPFVNDANGTRIYFYPDSQGYCNIQKGFYVNEQRALFSRYLKESCVMGLMEGMSGITTGHVREYKGEERTFSYDAEEGSLAQRDERVAFIVDKMGIGPGDKSAETEAKNRGIAKQLAVDITLIAISGGVAGVATRLAIRGLASAAMALTTAEDSVLLRRGIYQTVSKYGSMSALSTEGMTAGMRAAYRTTRIGARGFEGSMFLVNNTLLNALFQQPKILASGMSTSDYIANTLGDPWKYIESIVTLSVVGRIGRGMDSLAIKSIFKEGLKINAEVLGLTGTGLTLKIAENVFKGKNASADLEEFLKPENIAHTFAMVIGLRIAHAATPTGNPFEAFKDAPVIEITQLKPIIVKLKKVTNDVEGKEDVVTTLADVVESGGPEVAKGKNDNQKNRPRTKKRRGGDKSKNKGEENERKKEDEEIKSVDGAEELTDYRTELNLEKIDYYSINNAGRYKLENKIYEFNDLVTSIWKNYISVGLTSMVMIYGKLSGKISGFTEGGVKTTDDVAYNRFANFLSRMVKGQELYIELDVLAGYSGAEGRSRWKITCNGDGTFTVKTEFATNVSDRGTSTNGELTPEGRNTSAGRGGNAIAPTSQKLSDSDLMGLILGNEGPKEEPITKKTIDNIKTKELVRENKEVLNEGNIETYNDAQLVERYQNNDVEIQCVDGRSQKRNDKLVIHVPGGEFGLYSKLLKALSDLRLTPTQSEKVFRKFMSNGRGVGGLGEARSKSTYAHSDNHGNKPGEKDSHHPDYFYGKDTKAEQFRCGCGHCNLFMGSPAVQKTTAIIDGKEVGYDIDVNQKRLLNEFYPNKGDNLDILTGYHLEKGIIVQNRNKDGSMSSLKSNGAVIKIMKDGKEEIVEKQVFSYDVEAIKTLIDHISIEVSDIMKSEGITKKPAKIAETRKGVLDLHTTLTVFHLLGFAQRLASAGDLYYLKTTKDGKIDLRSN